MLASLHQLTPCVIGIKIESAACASTESQYHKLTELRRSIWRFILSEISFLPPQIKAFLEAEMMTEAKQFKQSTTLNIKPVKKVKPSGDTKDKVKFHVITALHSNNVFLFCSCFLRSAPVSA